MRRATRRALRQLSPAHRVHRRANRAANKHLRRLGAATLVAAVAGAGGMAGRSLLPQLADPLRTRDLAPPVFVQPGPETENSPVGPLLEPQDIRPLLSSLRVDDRPYTGAPYDRDQWPHWTDPDGNGCDARQDALRANASPPLTGPTCSTTGGHWDLLYVDGDTSNPKDLDVDHVVPLGLAHRSGAAEWEPMRRLQFANDPLNLLPVQAAANRAKGDSPPDEWQPATRVGRCVMAARYLQVSVKYALTVTTNGRDALGHMIEECNP